MALMIKKKCVSLISVLVFAFAGSWTVPVQSARILAVQVFGANSHWNFMSAILRALVDKGHNVTVFTPITDGNRVNYTEIDISDSTPKLRGVELNVAVELWNNPFTTINWAFVLSRDLCDNAFENGKMIELLDNSRSDFDAFLTEPMFSECVSYPAHKLNIPLIYVTPLPMIGLMEWYYTGHVTNPATVSHSMAEHIITTTFIQRLTNTVILVYGVVLKEYKDLMLKYTKPKRYDLIPKIPPSLVFVNNNLIFGSSSTTPTEVINVGGIHMKKPRQLPKDILEFIEQSSHGVIYFTFGSVAKMSSLPENIKKTFIEVLAQVPQRVLWKYEDDFQDKPKNFMIKKWFPQRDILLHPKVKLFISHGGISGSYEAVDAGVPVLGFPLFGDQSRNIDSLVNAGMAISMDLFSVTKETLLKNVLKLVNDQKYMQNAKNTSEMFKDRPMSPEQSVVYWTEYVVRHNGAKHLKSHGYNLAWYQYYLLDVIITILILISLILYVIYSFFKYVFRNIISISNNVKPKSE